jgi:hypothetical protein
MKKLNQRIADRSRLARIGRQMLDRDEAEDLEDVVCREIRRLNPVPRLATVHVAETRPGHRIRIHEIELVN